MRRFRLILNVRFLLLAVQVLPFLPPVVFAQEVATPPTAPGKTQAEARVKTQVKTQVKTPVKAPAETMVVLGSATPVPLTESQRSVDVLPVEGQSLAAESA